MRLNGHGYELGEPEFSTGKPLYNLDLLATNPDAVVYVVEGEKAADALTTIGAVATTSGGADSAGRADWTPLRGRTVRLWPDNDQAGKGYIGIVAGILLALECDVSAIDIEHLYLQTKGDAADWVQSRQNLTLADLRALPRLTSPDVPDAMLADPERPRFSVVTMLELINAELPTPDLLLAPWLVTQGLAQVHAWRGTGKTHFSLGVAYAVASGGKFLRWQAPKPQPVLFLDGEMPAVALQQRLRAILEAEDRDLELDENMLRFLTPDLLNGAPPDLADADDQHELQEVIERCKPRLIVVDNISTLVRSGGAENDADAWLPVQAWALRMRRMGLAVLFVHHTGKGGLQRGTSKREDVLDAVINLKRPTPYNPADGARFIVEFEKSRYIYGDDTKSFEAQLGVDPSGYQIWTTKDIEDSTMERVVALTKDGLKPAAIAKELSVHRSTVARALQRAKKLGLAVIEGGKVDD